VTNILVFDPGETTGWSFFEDGVIETGTFHTWEGVWDKIGEYLSIKGFGIDTVIIESFRLRRGVALALAGSELLTVQVIGYIKAVCEYFEIEYIEQQPSCKSIKVAKIPNTCIHEMDAVRHGIYYLKKHKEIKPYRKYVQQMR